MISYDGSTAARGKAETDEFRTFRKQLYHASIAHILTPLKHYMTDYDVVRCPDNHFRRVIYDLGPFIADYPEQVVLAGIVTGWCPKYVSSSYNQINHSDRLSSQGAAHRRRDLVIMELEILAAMSIRNR